MNGTMSNTFLSSMTFFIVLNHNSYFLKKQMKWQLERWQEFPIPYYTVKNPPLVIPKPNKNLLHNTLEKIKGNSSIQKC